MTDPILPSHHARPPRGWLNDPNGLAWHDGRWHVFFQYNPDSHRHDRIRWGHASSTDLLHWDAEPDVLVPQQDGLNAVGSWSGCLTMDGEMPTICYTAVASTPAAAVGAIAHGSPDLRQWVPAGTAAAPRVRGGDHETRDPFVVTIEGHRYIIQGHGGPHGPAQVLVYDAERLDQWQLLGSLLDDDDPVAAEHAPADIWECPNLVRLGDSWVLLLSLWRHDGTVGQLCGVRWLAGEVAVTDGVPRFTARSGGVFDDGPALYAPQLLTHDGRTLVFGWAWELERADDVVAEHGWAGVISSPRELQVREGQLLQLLPRELREAAGEALGQEWQAAEHRCVRVAASSDAVLECSDAAGDHRWRLAAGSVVMVDGSLVEVFHDGRAATTRCYPSTSSRWSLTGEATATALD